MTPQEYDDMCNSIHDKLGRLPPGREREAECLKTASKLMDIMPSDALRAIVEEIKAQPDLMAHPLTGQMLDMIEGKLALREINP